MTNEKREKVYALFDRLGIKYRIVEHPPLFSAADNKEHRVNIGAIIFKNLFLHNKAKTAYYLLSLPLEKRADLKFVARLLEESRLSFGGEDELMEKLNIKPGSVSFLNVIDAPAEGMTLLLDKSALDYDLIGVHPNDNTATVIFSPREIPRILDACGVAYKFLDLGSDG